MLRAEDPDVIGTQELFKRQGDDIVERLPQFVSFGAGRRDGDILTESLTDARVAAAQSSGPEGTFHGFTESPKNARLDPVSRSAGKLGKNSHDPTRRALPVRSFSRGRTAGTGVSVVM